MIRCIVILKVQKTRRNKRANPKIADRKQDGIPDFTPIFDLIREERILSTILGQIPLDPHFPKAENGGIILGRQRS
jgi:hypothetical protein